MRLRGKMNTLLLPNKMIMWNNFFVNKFTEGCHLKNPQGLPSIKGSHSKRDQFSLSTQLIKPKFYP